jgi:UDP-GlcNAc:undecaprenyl-phosphate GlcNAc-1-phosphate transferase
LELRVLAAFGFGLVLCLAWTPLAARLAWRIAFLDRPAHYKRHSSPTPYLGGTAVMLAFLPIALAQSGRTGGYAPIILGATLLWVVGTVDDWRFVRPVTRLCIEALLAAWLWAAGLGWSITDLAVIDLPLTIFWVVGCVNSFNLLDNMDGAAASMAAAASAGIAVAASLNDHALVAAAAAGLCGACAGFLLFNLSRPAAKIFLGDGGSMPVGFIVAALLMSAVETPHETPAAVLVAGMLVGIPILDTALVLVSRTRRRISIATGGRDHLTHRLLSRLRTPRSVVAVMVAWQAALSTVALVSEELGEAQIVAATLAYALLLALAITRLESPTWNPQRQQANRAQDRPPGRSTVASTHSEPSPQLRSR